MRYAICTFLSIAAVLAQTPQPGEAANAIKAVRSITTSGVQYRPYYETVLYARVKADQDPTLDPKLALALRYYEASSRAWNLKIVTGPQSHEQAVALSAELLTPEFQQCKALVTFLAPLTAKKPLRPGDSMPAMLLAQKPNVLWSCAAGLIAESEAK